MRLVLVLVIPALFNDKFQQSKVYVLHVPQIQFIYGFWTFLLCSIDRFAVRWCRKLCLSRSCSPSKVVGIPFVPQKLIPMVQTAQQIKEILQLLLILVVDVPVVRVVQVLRCCRGEDHGAPTVAAR